MPPKKGKRSHNSDVANFDPESLNFCKGCDTTFPGGVLRHLSRGKTKCLETHYTQEEYQLMKKESTKRSKQKYTKSNPELVAKSNAVYYEKNQEKLQQNQAIYNRTNREKKMRY